MICEISLQVMTLICANFISIHQTVPAKKSQIKICAKVAIEADRQGVDPSLGMAVSWIESRFTSNVVSKAGAIGAMQILPKYWCPNKKRCDSIKYGIKALGYYLSKSGLRNGLCRYASGKSCKKNMRRIRYMKSVVKKRDSLEGIFNDLCIDGC